MNHRVQEIVLEPGEQLTLVIKGPVGEAEEGPVLPVPYLSQWEPGARRAPGDCGPACIAMAIHYLTDAEPTVDEVSEAARVPPGAQWASWEEIARGARAFGLKPRLCRPLTRQVIQEQIDASRPVVALVNYGALPDNQDSYKGAHFVLIVGYGADTVVLHDPDRLHGDSFGAFRALRWPVFLKALGTVSHTPGNSYDETGLLLDV